MTSEFVLKVTIETESEYKARDLASTVKRILLNFAPKIRKALDSVEQTGEPGSLTLHSVFRYSAENENDVFEFAEVFVKAITKELKSKGVSVATSETTVTPA